MKLPQNFVHWVNSTLLICIFAVVVFTRPRNATTIYELKNEKDQIKREKMIPVISVCGTTKISGSVAVVDMPAVEIDPISFPIEVKVEDSVKVEPEDFNGLPVRIQR